MSTRQAKMREKKIYERYRETLRRKGETSEVGCPDVGDCFGEAGFCSEPLEDGGTSVSLLTKFNILYMIDFYEFAIIFKKSYFAYVSFCPFLSLI